MSNCDDPRIGYVMQCRVCGEIVYELSPGFIEMLKKAETREQLVEMTRGFTANALPPLPKGWCQTCTRNEGVALELMRDP